ncbi:hypothetical protein GQ55_3G004300 [Panicum hallii var. hallii]|uniref:Uncharacterized protein n=1 Tax=Panicum hallii var. hallii TaxID=1504633 RepID=A0A2T7E4A8_9POAL|nr:hypothetical protein GQ55_3G004300 [Panicum hallii var. hallii]
MCLFRLLSLHALQPRLVKCRKLTEIASSLYTVAFFQLALAASFPLADELQTAPPKCYSSVVLVPCRLHKTRTRSLIQYVVPCMQHPPTISDFILVCRCKL